MKDKNIKNAIDKIKLDEASKVRILNKIQVDVKEKEKGYIMKKFNYKYVASACVVLIGVFTFMYSSKDKNIPSPDLVIGNTSEMVSEKLAIIGKIESIENTKDADGRDGDIIAKVSGKLKDNSVYEKVSVHIHASTNIVDKNDENLLETSDLKVGQNVAVYYNGTEDENMIGQISGLRVVILD